MVVFVMALAEGWLVDDFYGRRQAVHSRYSMLDDVDSFNERYGLAAQTFGKWLPLMVNLLVDAGDELTWSGWVRPGTST